MELTFGSLDEQEFQLLKTWFDDPELKRRISFPTPEWFAYVHTPGNYAWMVFEGNVPIGYVQFGYEGEKKAALAMGIKAEFRGQSYCKRILQALINRPEAAGLDCIEGYVEPDNIASQRCLISAGFHLVSETPDEDNMLKFEYRYYN